MSRVDIIRAWKDDEYFNRLSEAERLRLPQNPAGVVEVNDQDLLQAEGGTTYSLTFSCDSIIFCPYTLGCSVTITISTEDQLQ